VGIINAVKLRVPLLGCATTGESAPKVEVKTALLMGIALKTAHV